MEKSKPKIWERTTPLERKAFVIFSRLILTRELPNVQIFNEWIREYEKLKKGDNQ